MQNLKSNGTNEHVCKIEIESDVENSGYQGGNWERDKLRLTGINISVLLYIKQETNKNPLYSTWNSIMDYMGKESKKELSLLFSR